VIPRSEIQLPSPGIRHFIISSNLAESTADISATPPSARWMHLGA
jgi:hypothetical protein